MSHHREEDLRSHTSAAIEARNTNANPTWEWAINNELQEAVQHDTASEQEQQQVGCFLQDCLCADDGDEEIQLRTAEAR
eukprot:CAMPEP_0206518480 /NCGR_PEP_ID=MMETSP0324_2-20121206/64607_1 /ASSEMBLY_ACC=CAM_ASM_000836 /TAXON_ID=2866 /ORGANISM="Crypthecodinium cohnii, Strain Seligo" /LENGTH=78 /DNA_ID=CAMNT_0054011851 /DNA_START=93 /DNA_END=330 /DNA_ORIENTATION=+